AILNLISNALLHAKGCSHISLNLIESKEQLLICVSDDGCGMSREDVPVCIKRHATSKIKNAADLDGIMTLGFRGEALAAIGSVSKLRIMTKPRGNEMGTLLHSESGEILQYTETGCVDGTTIIVEDLFANIPARRKFLKKDSSEAMAVTAVVEKLALSRPDLAFRFISDGMLRFATNGDGDLKNCIYAVLGRDFAHRLTSVDDMTEGVGISGFIGTPENVRANRNYQNFFINGRYVKSRTAMAALEQAYSSYIPGDKFPVCVLSINLHPAYVDVNVHPAKLEVKFSNEQLVFNAIYSAVRGALTDKLDRPDSLLKTKDVFKKEARAISGFVPIPNGTSVRREQVKLKYDDRPVPDDGFETQKSAADSASLSPHPIQPPTDNDGVFSIPKLPSPVPSRDNTATPIPPVPLPFSIDPSQNTEITSSASDILSDDSDTSNDPLSRFMGNGRKSGKSTPVQRPAASKTFDPNGENPPVPLHTERPSNKADSTPNFARNEQTAPGEMTADKSPSAPVNGEKTAFSIPQSSKEARSTHNRAVSSLNRASSEPVQAPPYKLLGEIFNSYIMLETEGKLLLIDKHAAHERILFEDMKKNLKGETTSQMLLLPLEISLAPSELAAIDEYRTEIEASGYGYKLSDDGRTAIVDQIPAFLSNAAAEAMFVTVAGKLANGTGDVATTRDSFYEQALYQASCKAAIKAGRIYDEEHLKWICDRVLSNNEIRFCPHGRPVAFEMTQGEIERSFKRT
ncbi:MAG: hypothetical protein IKB34_02400, partial [Clostridia bacterium]|nr:hypothetical protein [Clostridia bacterium]